MSTLDPWDIIRVPKTVSKAELKKSYRKLAKHYHPDKPSGNKKKFMVLNWAYREIKTFITSREASFDTLKENTKNKEIPFDTNISDFANKNFNINEFNELFDKFYVPQIKTKEIRPPEDVQFPQIVNGDINSAYNNFMEEKAPQVINRLELLPSATVEQTTLGAKTLGITEMDDCTDYSKPNMLMTDYEKAYELRRESVIDDQFIDLIDAKNQREQPLNLSQEEQQRIEQRQQMQQQKKVDRLQMQQQLDSQAVERFNQMTQLLKK